MARIFITGSADGLGRGAAAELLAKGHEVIVHARSQARLSALADLTDRGAAAVVGDLADPDQTRGVADQVTALGATDAVIHNAGIGVGSGAAMLAVNVVAPYLLTGLIPADRHIYLSSSMHRGARVDLDLLDWSCRRETASYSESKWLVTMLALAVARYRPQLLSNAVDPGWVPTRMGGAGAPDDLELGHVTQAWLAVSDDAAARTSGGYWHHQQRLRPDSGVVDPHAQDALLAALAEHTGTPLP